MIRSSKGGQAIDFDNIDAFPLSIDVRIEDTIGGCAVLGGCKGLFGGVILASTLDDEGT